MHPRQVHDPNEAAAFPPSVHNGQFSNEFIPSHSAQSLGAVPAYAPGVPVLDLTSTSPAMPNIDAHLNNLKLFRSLKQHLSDESLSMYVSASDKLAHWMRKEQAFYNEARPYIVNFLEVAQVTLYKACRISPSPTHPFHISQCPPEAAHVVEAYVRLVQAVRKFEYKFIEPDYKSRLANVFLTVDPNLGRSPSAPFPMPVRPQTVIQPGPPPPFSSPLSGGPPPVFFSRPGTAPTASSPTTPVHPPPPAYATALPSGSTLPYALPSPVGSVGPTGTRPPSRPASGAQAQVVSAPSLLANSTLPQASPSLTSATGSTPSPSLSNISAGQVKPKPKAKTKKKLSMFGTMDYLSSDLEWYAKQKGKGAEEQKGKGTENKEEAGTEKVEEKAETKNEHAQAQENNPLGEECKDTGATNEEDRLAKSTVEEKQEPPKDLEQPIVARETILAPAAQLEEPKDEVPQPVLEPRLTEQNDGTAGDAAVEELDKTKAREDDGVPTEDAPMDVAAEDDSASDKVERILTDGIERESESQTAQAAAAEAMQLAADDPVATQPAQDTVTKEALEDDEQGVPQPMDVDKVEADAVHSAIQDREQAVQAKWGSSQVASNEGVATASKPKKKRRGPPGIPANQIVGERGVHTHPIATPSSRESSPETTLASVSSPTRKAPAHSARLRKPSIAGSSSESDAPLSSKVIARRIESDTRPKRIVPRVPRRTYSVQGPDKIEKTDNSDERRSTATSDSGNEDVEMQEPDAVRGHVSDPQGAAEPLSSSRYSSLTPASAMEEGEITSHDVGRSMTREDGEVTPMTIARSLEDEGPAKSDTQGAHRITFFDERAIVLAFERGIPRGESITLSFELNSDQAGLIKRWTERYNTSEDADELRCITLACHPYAECASMLDDADPASLDACKIFAREPSTWPLRSHPRLTFEGSEISKPVLPVTSLFINSENLLDISLYVHAGRNTVEISSAYGGTTDYVFVLHLHPPTASQREELEKRRTEDATWKLLLKNVTTLRLPEITTHFNLDASVGIC